MWPLRRRSQADHLSRYWTALVGGASSVELARLAEPLDAELLETVERVRRLRLAHKADQAFLDRLERQALHVFSQEVEGAPAGRTVAVPVSSREARPQLRNQTESPGRRRFRLQVATAAAIVLVLSLVVGLRTADRHGGPGATIVAPSVVGTRDVAGPGTAVATAQAQQAAVGINLANADGTEAAGLFDGQDARDPAWSPDGTRIVFAASDGIFAVGADGSGLTPVVDTADREILPTWSPDGDRIAFATDTGHVFVVDGDGTDLNQVATLDIAGATPDSGPAGEGYVNGAAYRWRPSWAPDGSRLAVVAGQQDASNIFLVAADGSGLSQLTDQTGNSTSPAWSPDGTAIAYIYTPRFGSQAGLYVVGPDGTEPRRLTDLDPGADDTPSWSGDGQSLLVAGQSAGVVVVRVGGSGVTRLTALPSGVTAANWSPDGTKIAFLAGDMPYVIGTDGSGLVRLADLPSDGSAPVWSPDGSRIVFACQPLVGTP